MAAIGLLGGTFDPVHLGHLHLAEAVLSECRLDRIMLIPSAHPPHKNTGAVCAIEHRLNMLNAAVAGRSAYLISEIEVSRPWPSYTVDTLQALHARQHERTDYHFVIGSDAFLEIESWHCWEAVLRLTNFIIGIRTGSRTADVERLLLRTGFRACAADHSWRHGRWGTGVRFLTREIDDISSTDIRARIAAGRDWMHLVPAGVGSYIVHHGLYRKGV